MGYAILLLPPLSRPLWMDMMFLYCAAKADRPAGAPFIVREKPSATAARAVPAEITLSTLILLVVFVSISSFRRTTSPLYFYVWLDVPAIRIRI